MRVIIIKYIELIVFILFAQLISGCVSYKHGYISELLYENQPVPKESCIIRGIKNVSKVSFRKAYNDPSIYKCMTDCITKVRRFSYQVVGVDGYSYVSIYTRKSGKKIRNTYGWYPIGNMDSKKRKTVTNALNEVSASIYKECAEEIE